MVIQLFKNKVVDKSNPIAPIVSLKQQIEKNIALMSEAMGKGKHNTFMMLRDEVNKQVDAYINMRKLRAVG